MYQKIRPNSAISRQIQDGKRIMPAFRKKLSAEEVAQVVGYVKRLRNN